MRILIHSLIILIIKATTSNTNFNKKQSYNITNVDMSNIPDLVKEKSNIGEILDTMASRKYKSCRSSVLYNPINKLYYIRNPTIAKSTSLQDYLAFKCKSLKSRIVSSRQRFFLAFKDVEQLLDHNDDSILNVGIHEVTDIRNGLELSLFPVKFFKGLPEENYTQDMEHICYDSVKILGIDKNNNDYLILTSMDIHRIVICNDYDVEKTFNMNNFIRYSSYCDEFCSDDFIYFSSELIKCRCEFYTYIEDLKKNKNYYKNETMSECFVGRKLDKYEIFANSYEINSKLSKQNEDAHYRYYFHLIVMIFNLQILYAVYFTTKNSIFIKFTNIFYIILVIMFYLPKRINFSQSDFYSLIPKLCEVVSDLYPIILMIYYSCDLNYTNKQYDVLKLALVIFTNSFEFILKETKINEIEITLRLILIIFTYIMLSQGFLEFLIIHVRIRLISGFFSRMSLYLVELGYFTNISVPLVVILGKPRDEYIYTDNLLFQTNYLKLNPFFEKLYENWFLEALNFHKFKDILLFLQVLRYLYVLLILTIVNQHRLFAKVRSYVMQFKLDKIAATLINIPYMNIMNIFYSQNELVNYIHLPIVVSLIYSNLLITRECLRIFVIHIAVGFVISCLSGRDRPPPRVNNNIATN
jgi:hypothetical protein